MSGINGLAIVLSIVVWIATQYLGAGTGMASSQQIEEGSPDDIYLKRKDTAAGIAAMGALLTFITQWIPVAIVRTVGQIMMVIAILALLSVWTGIIGYGLPEDE